MFRAGALGSIWAIILLTVIARRASHEIVMSANGVFYSSVTLLLTAITFELVVLLVVRRRIRDGSSGAAWATRLSAVVDIVLPLISIALFQAFSPRGAVAALTGPVVLVLPLVTVLSILRLRTLVTLLTGVGAGLAHALLVLVAIKTTDIEPAQWPLLFMYSFMVALSGIAAAVVTYQARAYVTEAVEETALAEKAQRELNTIEHDLGVARSIQQGLMPSTSPKLAGFDIAGMARPAQQTGGDYYDWQPLPDGRLLVVLADVSGHGIGPALVMAVCRAYARASAPAAVDAAGLLAQINSLIYQDLSSSGRFITMALAFLSPDGSIDLVSAGHGPTMLYSAETGTIESFGGDGIPLGIMPDADYGPVNRRTLKPGDALLLLTDGFMEWQGREGDLYGTDRLQASFKEAAKGPAQAILDRIDADVHAFAKGNAQQDDTTVVAIKRVIQPT